MGGSPERRIMKRPMNALAAILFLLAQDSLETLGKQFEIEKDRPAAERLATLGLIGALRTDEAAGFLGKALAGENDLDLQLHIVACLGDCGTPAAAGLLISTIRKQEEPLALREVAVEVLGKIPSKPVQDFLTDFARRGGSLRSRAFAGLMAFPLAGTEALWREALEDTDPEVRRRAYRKLAPLKDRRVLDLTRKVIQDRIEIGPVLIDAIAPWKAQGGAEAVKLLLPPAATADPEVRAAISEALGAVEGDKAAEAVYDGLRDPAKPVRLTVVGALATLRHARAIQHLEGALRDKEIEVRLAAVDAIAARRDRRSEEILRREAQKSEGETVHASIRALGGYLSEDTLKLLGKLATQGGIESRVTALETLGDLGRPDFLPVFDQALKSREWPARVVAVRQIAKLKTKESVDLLVERIGREEGRVLGDIAEALQRLTGKGFITSAVHWKDWWAVNRETFAFGAEAEAAGGVGVTTYHGVPVTSHRIIFCLDISGSMESSTGEKTGETRLAMAKKELARVLSSLDRAAQVNIVFFDDRVEPWMRQLVQIKPNLPRALQRIESVKSRGATNVYDTLELCFTDSAVDTIYLLSDGEPNMGKFTDTVEILREIRRINRSRQIVIHTVSLGVSELMKKLAEENGGRYVEKK
jgi:HEAT repeat protein